MSDLEEGLLVWAEGLAAWQRDLLRRLAAGEAIGTQTLREYANAVARAELSESLPWFEEPSFDLEQSFSPLVATQLTAVVVGAEPVKITRLLHEIGANDLAPGAALDFEASGLTIVAGKNGSGKSGYTRILKQVATSRASEAVLPNAFRPQLAPKAVVSYTLGPTPQEAFVWESGSDSSSADLNRVRVFDSRSANVHLAGAAEVAYIPHALRIMGSYTRYLQEISALIDVDIQQLELQARDWPELNTGTGQNILENLGTTASAEALSNLVALTDLETEELAGIPAQLQDLNTSNPAAQAVLARQRATQLESLADALESASAKFSFEMIALSEQRRSAVMLANSRVDDARAALVIDGEFELTGGTEWQRMWAATLEFAALHSEHDFPNEVDWSVCPLCQQTLSIEAHARLNRFAEFMLGQAQAELAEARKLRDADVEALEGLSFEALITPELVDMVAIYHPEMRESLPALSARMTGLRASLVGEGKPRDAAVQPESPLVPEIEAVVAALRESAASERATSDALADSDKSAAAAANLLERRSDLLVRAGLIKSRAEIGAQHDRLVRISALNRAKSKCATSSASRKNSELSRAYVDKVCRQFEVEATRLGLDRVPVELVFDGSSRGVSFIKLRLKSAPQVPVAQVLSEGEQRVTALAGFFADLTESGDNSALVFDDPVSSLDQEYRVKVARRLLDESEQRQVLVFTHDFSFVQYMYEEKKIKDLEAAAEGRSALPLINYLHIARGEQGAGLATTADQWRHVGIKERIGRLKERAQNAAVIYSKGDILGYETQARDIVGSIRDTWEAFVEVEFLNNVVTRHDRAVQTNRLKKLTDISDADVAAIDLGMTVGSRFMTGHAAPIGDASAMMTPQDLQDEIQKLVDFRGAVLARRK